MLRTEVTVGGCCWAVEPTIRRSLFYEVNAKSYASVAREVIRKFLLAPRCSSCSTNYASDIPASGRLLFTRLAGGDSGVAVWRLAVAFRVDFLLTPRQHILRRDVADGTVQADVVVMLDVSLHQAQRIVQRERCSGPDTLALQRLVPTLDFPIRLGIVGGSSDMRHARDANELFEVASDELRPVVRDDPRLRHRVLLLGAFENYFDIRFPDGLTQGPMHEETT